MKKVSFDFDETLDNLHVQEYAAKLVRKGYDVHILTSRMPSDAPGWQWSNNDLFKVAKRLGIKKSNIHFTSFTPKHIFFENHKDFIFHLDNDDNEINGINEHTKVVGVLYDMNWENNCKLIVQKS